MIWAAVPCSPCYNPEEYIFGERRNGKKVFECWRGTHECMVAITAEEVCDVVVRQIASFEKEAQAPTNTALDGIELLTSFNEESRIK